MARLCVWVSVGAASIFQLACATVPPESAPPPVPLGGAALATNDTAGRPLVPAGFGSLHQDDLSFHMTAGGVLIRALPLDESIIRLLTPDSYKAMRELQQNNSKMIDAVSRRYGGRRVSVWFVSFYGVEPDARFIPQDLNITSSGRDFRALDLIPLTTNFSEQRLHQRETQNALYLFDGDIELDQLVTVSYQGLSDDSWDQTLQRIERERALIQARAHKTVPPTYE